MCRLCNKRSRSKNRRTGRMFANGYNNPYRVNIYGNVGNVGDINNPECKTFVGETVEVNLNYTSIRTPKRHRKKREEKPIITTHPTVVEGAKMPVWKKWLIGVAVATSVAPLGITTYKYYNQL